MGFIFVYNVSRHYLDSIFGNHRQFIGPEVCKLFAFTKTLSSERAAWKNFRESSQIPMRFFYSNEWFAEWHTKFHYKMLPLILLEDRSGKKELFMGASEINAIASVDEFIIEIKERLKNH